MQNKTNSGHVTPGARSFVHVGACSARDDCGTPRCQSSQEITKRPRLDKTRSERGQEEKLRGNSDSEYWHCGVFQAPLLRTAGLPDSSIIVWRLSPSQTVSRHCDAAGVPVSRTDDCGTPRCQSSQEITKRLRLDRTRSERQLPLDPSGS